MRITKRFHNSRIAILGKIFANSRLVEIWRNYVKQQLRSLEILDLHDYYDFNVNIRQNSYRIAEEIKTGLYRPGSPLVYRLEKKMGISRHLILPTPTDCLALQAITNFIAGEILAMGPFKANTFYSRIRHSKKDIENIGSSDPYEIGAQWRKFQSEILGFKDEFEFVISTDITNYFDNIGLRELRNVVSALTKIDEVVWDLLFQIIDQISWSPDYLPKSFRGLPVVNIEPIRLLAHCLLYELDQFIGNETHGNFVRWMDDINFGANSKDAAYQILGDANDLLKSRGLALNLQKTELIDSEKLSEALFRDEHDWLDEIADKIAKKSFDDERLLIQRFEYHLIHNSSRKGNDKITKRYLTLAGKLRTPSFLNFISEIYRSQPSLRFAVYNYARLLSVTPFLLNKLDELIHKTYFFDDVSLFLLIRLVTALNLDKSEATKQFLRRTMDFLKQRKGTFDFYCFLWFAAKYGHSREIYEHLYKLENWWIKDGFLARQVVPVLSRTRAFNEGKTDQMLDVILKSGHSDAASVIYNLRALASSSSRPQGFTGYFFYKTELYPLPKYLILFNLLSSNNKNLCDFLRPKMREIICDHWMLHWLEDSRLIQ